MVERRCAATAVAPRLHFVGLDGSATSLVAALATMRQLRPQQVMLETCDQRKLLAERQGNVEANPTSTSADSSSTAMPGNPRPLSHVDAVGLVHGGLRGSEVLAFIEVASEIDAEVYMVDRAYQETQNRVARWLVCSPRELSAFFRHSAARLSGGVSPGSLAEVCPTVHEILVDERQLHIATEVQLGAWRLHGGLFLVWMFWCSVLRSKSTACSACSSRHPWHSGALRMEKRQPGCGRSSSWWCTW